MAPITPKMKKQASSAKRVLGNEMVFVILGTGPKASRETKIFHRNLLMSISGFFATGVTLSFKEASTGVFELEEEDSDTFSVFEQWVYKDRLFIKKPSSSSASEDTEDDCKEWECLPRLYTLGERLDAPKFKDAVISAIIEKVNESKVVPDNWAAYVYQNTVSACALRRLIVDFHIFAHQGKLLKKGACPDAEELEVEFLQDAMERMSDAGSSVFAADAGEMPWSDACVYHEHGEGACHLADDEDAAASPSPAPLRRSARSVPTSSFLNAVGSSTNANPLGSPSR
ncbi:hypothetical protein E4T50_08457 [Aureobasidium sp. EXF-12298]|nr:hypothetical protein E4T50_08457 [Aureobasidium sp. EXF-12298]